MSSLLDRLRSGELLRHRLVRNAAALSIVQLSAYFAPLAVLPYLSRVLSTEHFGLIAFSTTFNFYFVSLVEYGFNLTATRRIAIYGKDPQRLSKIFSSVLAAKALLTISGFGLMLSVVLATPKLRPNLVLFVIGYMTVVGDLLFPLWLFQGLQKMENLVWRDLCSKGLALCLIFAFVRKDGDYLWAAAFQAGSTVIAGIVGLVSVFFLTQVRFVLPSLDEVFTALREGWPVFLSMAALTLSSSTNTFILGLYSGATDVAYYSSASRLVVAIRMMISPIVTAFYPHISKMAFTSRQSAVDFLRRYSMVLILPFLGVTASLFLAASPIIHIIYGAKYTPAVLLLRVLAPSVLLLAIQHAYSTFYMLAFGYEKEYSRIILQSTILNFCVLVPMIYLAWPPLAIALTGLTVDIFAAIMMYLFYRKTTAPVPHAVTA